jgi:hypothetical protein
MPAGIEPVGTNPLPRKGRSTNGIGRLLAVSTLLDTMPSATVSQVSAVGRNPMSSATTELETDVATSDQAFELVRRSFRDELALVEHRDPVGEPVSLFEILRRQEDRHAVDEEVADDLPHGVAAAGSRPVVGSSRKMMRRLPTRVIARSSRRRIPPE